MTTYLSRSAWTTAGVGGSTLTGSQLVGVAVHWPGTTQAAIGVQSQSATAARIRGYRDFHVNTRGWSDIGYNLIIDQAGRVWQGRTTSWAGNRVGAHAASTSNPDANRKYVGVLLILGQSEQPSAAMIEAFQDWYHTRFLPIWPGRTDVRGHGQVPGAQTNCPGSRALAKIVDLKQLPEDDMPTAQEIAKAVWDYDIQKVSNPDQKMTAKSYLSYPHSYILRILTATTKALGSTTTTPRQAWQRAELRSLAVLDLVKAQQPLIEAAAAGQTMSAEEVQTVAAACASAVPDSLADDMVDEIGERLSAETAEP